jgi:hypothetical protein
VKKKKSTTAGGGGQKQTTATSVITPFTPGDLPRLSDAEPVTIRSVVKLDQRSMVWAYEGSIATDVESMGPFLAVLMTATAIGSAWLAYAAVFYIDHTGWGTVIMITLACLLLALAVGCIALAVYFLRISIFSSYGDLHFNRKSGTVYMRENKVAIQMDWKHVRPYARLGFGPPQLGGAPIMSLMLIEYYPDQPDQWKSRMTVAGPLPNREGCQQVWEMIRRYMEDSPENLPEIEVVPGTRTWVSALIEYGPLSGYLSTPAEIVAKLRARNWWPSINPLNILYWIGAWPWPLSATLYARFRPRPKLPPEWTKDEAPLPGEPNPYRIVPRAPGEAAGRKKAALVLGITCGLCNLIGITLYLAGLTPLWLAMFGKG